jgi:hypothetical protein
MNIRSHKPAENKQNDSKYSFPSENYSFHSICNYLHLPRKNTQWLGEELMAKFVFPRCM